MPVDSFKYLPRLISAVYKLTDQEPELPIPWTSLPRSLAHCKFGLVTSAGFYDKGIDPPFDLEREKREPTWGDPTYRQIRSNISSGELGLSHLHINTAYAQDDCNVMLPIQRFYELVERGQIGGLADYAYSFMGYQGYPPDTSEWRNCYALQVAEKLKSEQVNCVLLTPG